MQWRRGRNVSVHGIERLAREIAGDERDRHIQVRRLIQWMHQVFEWTATDYQQRTVGEILQRRAGNCAEQSRVLAHLVHSLGIEHRRIAEVNIQPPSQERGEFAANMVAAKGPSASVFGYIHNDHRWIEIRDASSEDWIPVDATLGICGIEEWMKGRMGFGERPEAAKDMIVPIMIFVLGEQNQIIEERSEHYLIRLYNEYIIKNDVHDVQLLTAWGQSIRNLSAVGKQAFLGERSLHESATIIESAYSLSQKIREELQVGREKAAGSNKN